MAEAFCFSLNHDSSHSFTQHNSYCDELLITGLTLCAYRCARVVVAQS